MTTFLDTNFIKCWWKSPDRHITNWIFALSTAKLRITQFHCLRSGSLELSTSSHSRPVFIAILFLQPCQDRAYGVNSLQHVRDSL